MNQLPQEIVDSICSYLDHDSLKSVLLISPKFQFAAEFYSEAFRNFSLTTENVNKFISTYSSRRFRYLRQVAFQVVIPTTDRDAFLDGWDDGDNIFRESKEELDNVDEIYTRQINLLFSTLHTVETYKCNRAAPGNIHLKLFTPIMPRRTQGFLQWAFISWRVHLLAPETLPTITSVHELTLENPEQNWCSDGTTTALRKLDLRVILDLSNKLSSLSTLNCNIGVEELFQNTITSEEFRYITQDWLGPRKDSRSDFIKPLNDITLHNLRNAKLDFLYGEGYYSINYLEQRLPMPNLTAPSLHDPFSTCLRILSQQLRTMHLRAIADATLFWPSDGSIPNWPNLEHLHVEFYMATPSGSWYFNGPPGVDFGGAEVGYTGIETEMYPPLAYAERDNTLWEKTCEWDIDEYQLGTLQYRVVPNDATLVPFLTAFAKAVTYMPRLRTFALWSPLSLRTDSDETYEEVDFESISGTANHLRRFDELGWGIAYTGAHEIAFTDGFEKSSIGQRQIWWRTGMWRPPKELHVLFQQFGQEHHRDNLLESFDNEGLGSYKDFRYHVCKYFRDTWTYFQAQATAKMF
jgi:hypothetical protein